MKLSLLKSKKGAALESAILFLIIVFTFCFLITSTTLLGRYQSKLDKTKNSLEFEREQLTENFLAYVKDEKSEKTFEDYVTDNENDSYAFESQANILEDGATQYTLTVTRKSDKSEFLSICAEKSADGTIKLLYCRTPN